MKYHNIPKDTMHQKEKKWRISKEVGGRLKKDTRNNWKQKTQSQENWNIIYPCFLTTYKISGKCCKMFKQFVKNSVPNRKIAFGYCEVGLVDK